MFTSLLSEEANAAPAGRDPAGRAFATDLNLDQIVEAVAGDRAERELITGLLYQQVRDLGTLRYRHEVFRDLDDSSLFAAAGQFAAQMHRVRTHLDQVTKMDSAEQRQGWFLDAAAIYCEAVRSLAAGLAAGPVASRALRACSRAGLIREDDDAGTVFRNGHREAAFRSQGQRAAGEVTGDRACGRGA